MRLLKGLLSLLIAVGLPVAGCSSPVPKVSPSAAADPAATTEAQRLLTRLHAQEGKGILFGHQHDLSLGFTFEQGDGSASDTAAAVGDYPAVFGWDSLIAEGDERPGEAGAPRETNVEALASIIRQADALGGVNTLTMHMPNPVTGGNFRDTSGDAVASVLPGGARNADLTAHLDRLADTITAAKRADGTLIPVIMRPWHEHNGDWFWWGAGHATPEQYAELFRFTVEYLRDNRGLHNLLYAYSPNSPLDGDPTRYLNGYPGDDYVDVFGYDSYDNTGGSGEWINSTIADLSMVVRLADEHGKVPAWTEFGLREGSASGPRWFTSVLESLKRDENARRLAWMLTWANYGHGDREHAYVPYPAHGNYPAHPLLSDFRAFHDDPWTIFAKEWKR